MKKIIKKIGLFEFFFVNLYLMNLKNFYYENKILPFYINDVNLMLIF